MQSVDGDTAQVPAQIAEELKLPCIAYVTGRRVQEQAIRVHPHHQRRQPDGRREEAAGRRHRGQVRVPAVCDVRGHPLGDQGPRDPVGRRRHQRAADRRQRLQDGGDSRLPARQEHPQVQAGQRRRRAGPDHRRELQEGRWPGRGHRQEGRRQVRPAEAAGEPASTEASRARPRSRKTTTCWPRLSRTRASQDVDQIDEAAQEKILAAAGESLPQEGPGGHARRLSRRPSPPSRARSGSSPSTATASCIRPRSS